MKTGVPGKGVCNATGTADWLHATNPTVRKATPNRLTRDFN
jgi:hypothetical protein